MKKNASSLISRSVLTALFGAGTLFFSSQTGYSTAPQWVTWEGSAGGNGHQYLAVPGFAGLNWNSANALAQAQGGYLATVTSPAESDFVFSLVNSPQFFTGLNGSGPALGGLQQIGATEPGGGWFWTTGEAWSYTNWHPTQPNNNPGQEDRLTMFSLIPNTPSPLWNDINQLDQNIGGYVVGVEPEPSALALLAGGVLILARTIKQRKWGVA